MRKKIWLLNIIKNIPILLFPLFFSYSASAQNKTPLVKQWDKRFGGDDAEILASFQQTKDGGYILGGLSVSGISGDKTQNMQGGGDYWVVKIDSAGKKQWDKDFGGTDKDWLTTLQQTRDGGYILGGYSTSGIGGDKTQDAQGGNDYWVVKIDSVGKKQWDKDFGGTEQDWLTSLQQTKDGGYILGGSSNSGISGDKTQNIDGNNDYWVVKIDSLGNKQWDKDFGGDNFDWLQSLVQTKDGGYILGGSLGKSKFSKGGGDYWIIKIDAVGNKQWDKVYGGANYENLKSLVQTTDGGYILAGESNSQAGLDKTQDLKGGINDFDAWIVKIDSLGNKQWDKDFGALGRLGKCGTVCNILQTTDKGFLLGTSSFSQAGGDKSENNLGEQQSWIIKMDSVGNKLWDKTILTGSYDNGGYILECRGGGYIVANGTSDLKGGYKTKKGRGKTDYWIVKFNNAATTLPAR